MHWAPGTGPSRHVVRSGERWVNTMCGLPWLGARFRWPSTMIHSCIGCSRPTHSSDGSTSRFAIPLTARRERTRTEDPGRHQAGCGPCQSRTMWSEAMAEGLAAGYWDRDRRSCCGAPGRSPDVPKSADPVFQPSNVTRPNERPGSGTETPGGAWISHPTHQWCTPANHTSACDGNTANGEKSRSINALACRHECDQNARIARPRDYCRAIRVLPRKHRGTEAVRPPRA